MRWTVSCYGVSVQKPKLANPEWVRGITDDGLGNYGTVLDIVRAGLIYAPRTKGLRQGLY
jgi:hypothetical protein